MERADEGGSLSQFIGMPQQTAAQVQFGLARPTSPRASAQPEWPSADARLQRDAELDQRVVEPDIHIRGIMEDRREQVDALP